MHEQSGSNGSSQEPHRCEVGCKNHGYTGDRDRRWIVFGGGWSSEALRFRQIRKLLCGCRSTSLGLFRFRSDRSPGRHSDACAANSALCCLVAAGHDLSHCLEALVSTRNVFPYTANCLDSTSDCSCLAPGITAQEQRGLTTLAQEWDRQDEPKMDRDT